jgi:hypothetical protein
MMRQLALLIVPVLGLRQVGSGYALHFGGRRRFAEQFGRYARVFFRCRHLWIHHLSVNLVIHYSP